MSDPDWSAELTDPGTVREVLGSPPPPLGDYSLTSLLVDEREASVTLRFFSFDVPAGAAELWHARGHTSVEFVLVCVGVQNLVVEGWSGYPTTHISLSGGKVVLAGREKHMSFEAAEIRAEPPVGLRSSRTAV